MNNDLNWDHLRFFLAVNKAGSVIAAAKDLGVSHATVLRNVGKLEDSLGLRLFEPLRTGYRVTSEGEGILSEALAMEANVHALAGRALSKNPDPRGSLVVSLPDSRLLNLLPLMPPFLAAFPGIELKIRTDHDWPANNRERKNIPIAAVEIVLTNEPPQELVGRQLGRLGFEVRASPSYVKGDDEPYCLSEDSDWVIWNHQASSRSNELRRWQTKVFRRLAGRPKIVAEAQHYGDALNLVQKGLGLALLRDGVADGLIAVPNAQRVPALGIWILTCPELKDSGCVRTFMDFITRNWPEIV